MILTTMAAVPIALLGLLPMALLFLSAAGFTLLFLGRVLVSSALGEVHHPRWPEWDLDDMLHGFGRWAWALLIGGVLGGFPATAYWLYCGDVDLFDAIILAELLAVGAVYGQMALLATLLHDDPLAANPITVVRSLWQAGWGCLAPSLVGGSAALVALFALGGVSRIDNGLVAAVAFWAFWVLVLYEAMVVLRVLGLFYHRRAAALGWFRDRPRWAPGRDEDFVHGRAEGRFPWRSMRVDMPFRDTPFWAALHPIEGGGYWAEVQELPGCVAQANHLDELEQNVAQAIIDWLQESPEKTADEARRLAEIQGGQPSTEESYPQPYPYLPPSGWEEDHE